MAVRFSEIKRGVNLSEKQSSHFFDSLIACVKPGEAPGQLDSPHGIAVDPENERIYIAEGFECCSTRKQFARVSIFSEAGEFINCFTHQRMRSLWGIAIHRNRVYVTDIRVHALFHLEGETDLRLVTCLGSRGSGVGQFDDPRQLSVSTTGDIYVADCENGRIQILDSSLHPIRVVTHPTMHRPRDVKLTREEMYVLSDIDSPCLHVFSHSGHKLRSLISRGDRMHVAIPIFFCLDADAGVIISDFCSDEINFFSNNGDLLHTLGGSGWEVGMFDRSQGLALTADLKLVTVSGHPHHRLQIFS